jgi:acyl-CoA oxidase
MHTTHEQPITPGILSLLPLFYIGWSDSVLSPTEMELIHRKIRAMKHLSDDEQAYLIAYTRPQHPPTPDVFKSWLDAMRHAAAQLPPSAHRSLAELGVEMARTHPAAQAAAPYDDPALRQALTDIETELGVKTLEDLQGMIRQLGAHHLAAESSSVSFDPTRLRAILDGPRAALKQSVRQLLRDPFFEHRNLRDKEAHRLRTLAMTKALAEQGYGALGYPPEAGGRSSMGDYAAVFQMLAQHDLSLTVKFGVQFGLFGGAILRLGTESHHRMYLPPAGTTELLGCFAMTEKGHGSNVKDLETTATYDHATQTITVHTPRYEAGKEYIGNTLHGSMAVVFAQLIVEGQSHGIHAVVVPYRDADGHPLPGVEIEDCGYKLGLNGVDNGRLWFDQVKVPKANLLNRYGDIDANGHYTSPIENDNKRFFTMLGALVGGRICVGLGALSAAEAALGIAVRYALQRRQFAPTDGEPETLLMDYPTHQHRLLPLVVKNYAYRFALQHLAERYDVAQPDDMRQIETQAAGLKAMATWLATETIQECREACGGMGYLSENRFADLKADSDIFTTFEGDNTVLLQLVAKGLLTEFRQSFHDDGFRAVVRYLGSKVSQTMAVYNPYFTGNTDLEHLLSAEFHAEALQYREQKVLLSLSDRMRDYLKRRLSPYDAFLKCQMHMVVLAKAYVEHLVYREFSDALTQIPIGPERDLLESVRTYYALHCISEDKGWYLEAEYMSGEKSKAIRSLLNKLTQELRNEVEGMV